MRILIVDDEQNILEVLGEFVSGLGHQVDLASNFAHALALMQQTAYGLMILDKNLEDDSENPEGGMTLLQYAKEHCPQSEVIMMTGYTSVQSAVSAMKLGAIDYLAKPFELSDLADKIAYVNEYKSFLNSQGTFQLFKTLSSQVLALLENRNDLPEEKLNQLLQKVGGRIDQVFGSQKEYERLIKIQAEALEKIEYHAQFLKNAISKDSPYNTLITKILHETKKRV
jgi:DNA-binding NtrC family response regulator